MAFVKISASCAALLLCASQQGVATASNGVNFDGTFGEEVWSDATVDGATTKLLYSGLGNATAYSKASYGVFLCAADIKTVQTMWAAVGTDYKYTIAACVMDSDNLVGDCAKADPDCTKVAATVFLTEQNEVAVEVEVRVTH